MVSPPLATELIRVVDVALDVRTGGSGALYTYSLEGEAAPGDAFIVPLGNRSVLAYATHTRVIKPEDLGFPIEHLRPPVGKVAGLSLPESLVWLVERVAEEYLCPLPVALGAATPPGARDRLVTAWVLGQQPAENDALTTLQREVLRTLQDSGGSLIEKKGKKLDAGTLKALKLLRAKGYVDQVLQFAPVKESKKPQALLRLIRDGGRVESFLKNEGRKKPAQALTIMRLQEADDAALMASEIKGLSGVTDTTIKALVDAGLLEPVEADELQRKPAPTPNKHQQLAIDAVVDSVHETAFKPFLLYGITGSGKTEVYMRAAAEALKRGRQVLYLVPEIALATQVIAQLRERFGRRVAILHSELAPGERMESWMRIRSGEAPIVLGARSALFSPLDDIGLVIVDEEHEAGYKQESSPRYHARRLARLLAERHRCPLILGSATPSVESFYEAEQGRLELLSLPSRAASAKLPSVHLEDLTEGYKLGKPAILSDELCKHVELVLAKKEQVILFLNRRAYAPFLICRDCGHQFKCPHCAVSLAFSRRDRRMRCHHCGYHVAPPEVCPKCQGVRLNPFGVGTEKVEEAVQIAFPDITVARLDRDIARKKGALEETLARFRSGEVDVLVGTQMVAKGLDFPNVTLVGVIAADISLNIPDFRASERTFQLLSQVAGRAGRGHAPGHVVIQTFNPEHVAVRTARDHSYLGLYEAIKTERQDANYPPFCRLINLLLTGESRSAVVAASNEIASLLEGANAEVLGPADCAIERLQGRWRRHLLLKLPSDGSVAEIGKRLEGFSSKAVMLTIDVDPYTLV